MDETQTMATGGGEEESNALTILWRIENLSRFLIGFHWNKVSSLKFHPCSIGDNLIRLFFCLRGESADDENVHFRLELPSSVGSVDCETSLLACDGSPLVTRKAACLDVMNRVASYELTDLLTQEELFVTKKSTFLPHDTLTVRCRLWKSEGNFPFSEFFSARSRVEFAEGSVSWPVGGINRPSLDKGYSNTVRLECVHEYVYFGLRCYLGDSVVDNSDLKVIVTTDGLVRDYVLKLEVFVSNNKQELLEVGEKDFFFSDTLKRGFTIPILGFTDILREKMSLSTCDEGLSLLFRLTAVCKDVSECIEKTFIAASNDLLPRALIGDCLTSLTEDAATCGTLPSPLHPQSLAVSTAGGGGTERNAITILWHIQNLNYFEKGFSLDRGIWSPKFRPRSLDKDESILLSFWLESDILNDKKVHLRLDEVPGGGVDCEIALVACDGSSLVTRKGKGYDFCDFEKKTNFPTRKELFVTKKSSFLPHDTLRIRCRFWNSEGNFSHNEFIHARTTLEFADKFVLWPIRGIGALDSRQSATFPVSLQFIHEDVRIGVHYELAGDSLQNSDLVVTLTSYEMSKEYSMTLEVSVSDNKTEMIKLGKEDYFFSSKEGMYDSLFPVSEKRYSLKISTVGLKKSLRKKLSLLACDEGLGLLFHFTALCKDMSECIEKTVIGTFDDLSSCYA